MVPPKLTIFRRRILRKILLTTTALVAFGLTNAAVAETMSHVEKGITNSGSGKFVFHS